MHNSTTTTPTTSEATELRFRPPSSLAEDIAFGIEVNDPAILLAAIKRHGVEIDTFHSDDVTHNAIHDRMEVEGTPPLRVVSVMFTKNEDVADLLLALPADLFTADDGVELALRIIGSGRSYPDNAGMTVLLRDGREIVLLGGWDRSGGEAEKLTYIFGWRTDLPLGRPISSALH